MKYTLTGFLTALTIASMPCLAQSINRTQPVDFVATYRFTKNDKELFSETITFKEGEVGSVKKMTPTSYKSEIKAGQKKPIYRTFDTGRELESMAQLGVAENTALLRTRFHYAEMLQMNEDGYGGESIKLPTVEDMSTSVMRSVKLGEQETVFTHGDSNGNYRLTVIVSQVK